MQNKRESRNPNNSYLTNEMSEDRLHIVMIPWLAFGHMIPYLELAKLIAQKGHKISFLSTTRNINRLPKIPPTLALNLELIKLPLPHIDGLPDDAESTLDIPPQMVQYLMKAYDNIQEPVTRFLETSDPDWVLHDFASYWASSIAAKVGCKSAYMSIFIPPVLGFLGPVAGLVDSTQSERSKPEDFTLRSKWVNFSTSVAFKLHEIRKIFACVGGDVSGVSVMNRHGMSLRDCDVLAIRGCAEFDAEWLDVLRELHRKPVIPVGQLPTSENDDLDADNEDWLAMKAWLDKQERTVVYLAFGSEAIPSQQELNEIALGLEKSELPFFWVLKKRCGLTDPEPLELPNGFDERISDRGFICMGWAPQVKILAHDSIGGFLTHAGWSSVVESLQFKRPLILLTFSNDQGLTRSYLEDKKLGYPIPRDGSDGSFTRESVAGSLRLVVAEEEGKIYRDNAKEISWVFGDRKRQDHCVDSLLHQLHSFRNGVH
ncbi:UDP-glucuronosyl/UDP-glucosyltransferase [Dillenia turbinata]|uniref:UDP-glucuronosyl/UDP-glucosyltransferase n=1 Tax=Dillenia turbinata TaxID=194707 RepID=A0AAN8V9U5_9MAGN